MCTCRPLASFSSTKKSTLAPCWENSFRKLSSHFFLEIILDCVTHENCSRFDSIIIGNGILFMILEHEITRNFLSNSNKSRFYIDLHRLLFRNLSHANVLTSYTSCTRIRKERAIKKARRSVKPRSVPPLFRYNFPRYSPEFLEYTLSVVVLVICGLTRTLRRRKLLVTSASQRDGRETVVKRVMVTTRRNGIYRRKEISSPISLSPFSSF